MRAYVFHAVGLAEAQIVVDAGADVVSVQYAAEDAPVVQFSFQCNGYGALPDPLSPVNQIITPRCLRKLFFVRS